MKVKKGFTARALGAGEIEMVTLSRVSLCRFLCTGGHLDSVFN